MAGVGWLSLISWLLVRAGADYVGHSVVGEVEEVSSARDSEGTTATTGEATLREDLVEECPRERGWTGWDREEAMLPLSEVGEEGGKIKVSN